MAKITKPPPDDAAQSARFVETARKIEADTSNKEFARAFSKIVPKKPALSKRKRNTKA